MKTFIGILLTGVFIITFGFLRKIAPDRSNLEILGEQSHFPLVSGNNLNREIFEFPRDFIKNYNLVFIPFQQRQQEIVNTWIPFVLEIEGTFPDFIYYELPTIYEMPALSRTFINEGMRAGIPDDTVRQRTITLYIDKDSFKKALGIQSENEVYIFLVNKEGKILWSELGPYTKEKAQSMVDFLEGSIQ